MWVIYCASDLLGDSMSINIRMQLLDPYFHIFLYTFIGNFSTNIAPFSIISKMVHILVYCLFNLPVPASPLVRIIAAPSAILRKASPRFLAPHTKGTLNLDPRLSIWCSSSAGDNTAIILTYKYYTLFKPEHLDMSTSLLRLNLKCIRTFWFINHVNSYWF